MPTEAFSNYSRFFTLVNEGTNPLDGFEGDVLARVEEIKDALSKALGPDEWFSGRDEHVDLTGTDEGDFIRSNGGGEQIQGEGGDDWLVGSDDDGDSLYGGADDDLLEGGGGRDFLAPGDGEDTVIGGEGDDDVNLSADGDVDTIVFNEGDGADEITGFEDGVDVIDLSGRSDVSDFDDLVVKAVSGGVEVTFANGDTLLFEFMTKDQIDSGDFIF